MNSEEGHNCRDKKKTASNIEKYGLEVIIIERTDYLPFFAYSVGLWQTYQHPEIILFGFSTPTLHAIINDVADYVKEGKPIETGRTYNDFFEKGKAEFIKVDNLNLSDYFGFAIDLYNSHEFPALQLVWTDRNDKFPWEENFEEEFLYKQPLLDRNAEFKFREPKNLTTFTTKQWLKMKKPILRVVHDHDGDWQFLTGDQMQDDFVIVALEELIKKDQTLNDVFNLDYGEAADREHRGGKWIKSKVENEDEDEE